MGFFAKTVRVSSLLLLAFLLSIPVGARDIQFTEKELAAESVLPVFNQAKAVRSRRINLSGRFEIGAFGGAVLNEPFFSPFNVGGYMTYHFGEAFGLQLQYAKWLEGETTYKKQIEKAGLITIEGAPRLESLMLANIEWTAWYGKISLTKQWTSNLHLFVLAGGGLASVGGVMNPAVSLGLGQKFYFARWLALRFDLKGIYYKGADPLSSVITAGSPVPETSAFETQTSFNVLANVGLVFLL